MIKEVFSFKELAGEGRAMVWLERVKELSEWLWIWTQERKFLHTIRALKRR